jgi:AcrR family transcriptional regulator
MTTENEELAGARVSRRPRQPASASAPSQPGTAPGQRANPEQRPPRRRNPRGQGERLRDDIIEAASRLMADPAAPPLTLRAVAREAGVAATSVYLHFDDIESLVLAVADRRFGELVKVQDEARAVGEDPCQRVRTGALAYCEFGLAHQGHYQVMFANPLPLPAHVTPEQFPGRMAFDKLVNLVAACIGAEPEDQRAFFTAQLIWQQLHGIVSLRISRPRFPWPPVAETVTEAVDRLLAGAQSAARCLSRSYGQVQAAAVPFPARDHPYPAIHDATALRADNSHA